jgi:hypothetical protein
MAFNWHRFCVEPVALFMGICISASSTLSAQVNSVFTKNECVYVQVLSDRCYDLYGWDDQLADKDVAHRDKYVESWVVYWNIQGYSNQHDTRTVDACTRELLDTFFVRVR